MNADAAPNMPSASFLRRTFAAFQRETGQSPMPWIIVAALNFATQIAFRREMAPGEFGTLNTALGIIGLLTVPVLAVRLGFTHYLARNHSAERREVIESLRASSLLVTETFAWAWVAISLLLVFLLVPLLDLPRFSLHLFVLLNVFLALGGVVSGTICRNNGRLQFWSGLLIAAAATRLLIGAGLASRASWAESGLAAFLLAGFITLSPALRQTGTEAALRLKALRSILDRDFLLVLGATFSVVLALFLFSSADRIVAQSWFGVAIRERISLLPGNGYGFVTNVLDWDVFDAYQTAGLLGRALLWGTQPLLLVLFIQRARLTRTTPASLTFFWIYLGALLLGASFLILLRNPLSALFCGPDFAGTAHFVTVFSLAMVPLGLLQALGVFALASRRYHECFVLGGCSIGYTLLLYLQGRQPDLMPAYMFGGGLVALMIVLFVGVVRWGRKQP